MEKPIYIRLKTFLNENLVEVGLDEAGRGALAGPVVTSAVIMPKDFNHPLIKDSKLLNESQRQEARELVLEHAIAHQTFAIDVDKIEEINILRATMEGMKTCLDNMSHVHDEFDFILVDGDQFKGWNGIPFKTIPGGDNKYTSIAAASILAKTGRDLIMRKLNEGNEPYGWNSNKGYGTAAHIKAIKEHGPTSQHRHSFISHMLTTTDTLF
jgi:ribonuclease HII